MAGFGVTAEARTGTVPKAKQTSGRSRTSSELNSIYASGASCRLAAMTDHRQELLICSARRSATTICLEVATTWAFHELLG
jgi:hypothetical protein